MLKIIAIILLLCLLIKILNYSYSNTKMTLNLHLGKAVPYITPSVLNNSSNNKKTIENYENEVVYRKNKEVSNYKKNKLFNIKEEILIVLLFISCLVIGLIGFIFNL